MSNPGRRMRDSSLLANTLLEDLITLVKSPSVQRPQIPKLPSELHPLPPDISAYFVYPLSLEPYALNLLPSLRQKANLEHQKHLNFLNERKAMIENKKKAEMNRVAPGWNGAWDALEPASVASPTISTNQNQHNRQPSIEEDLVNGLEKLAR